MNELKEKVDLIIEEYTDDVLDALKVHVETFEYEFNYKENAYGGNPDINVYFCFKFNGIPYRPMKIKYHMATQTEQSFLNEIKAYLFDTIISIINL